MIFYWPFDDEPRKPSRLVDLIIRPWALPLLLHLERLTRNWKEQP